MTFSTSALIVGLLSKSILVKYKPAFSFAGFNVIVDSIPVCNPTPLSAMDRQVIFANYPSFSSMDLRRFLSALT